MADNLDKRDQTLNTRPAHEFLTALPTSMNQSICDSVLRAGASCGEDPAAAATDPSDPAAPGTATGAASATAAAPAGGLKCGPILAETGETTEATTAREASGGKVASTEADRAGESPTGCAGVCEYMVTRPSS